jgi:hypothetical protein
VTRLCHCRECCERRPHYSGEDVANEQARWRWTVSRVASLVIQCEACQRWLVESVA